MPIDISRLTGNFAVVSANESIDTVLSRLPNERAKRAFTYVVLVEAIGDTGKASYRVVQWRQVEEIAHRLLEPRGMEIGALPGLPTPVPAVEVDSISTQDALELRDEQRPLRVLVVLQNNHVIGLLVKAVRDDTELRDDPFGRATAAKPPQIEFESGVTLSPEEAAPSLPSPAPPAPEPPAPEPPAEDDRVINAWVSDHEKTEPLQVGESYELKFSIESPRSGALATALFDAQRIFNKPEIAQVDVIVALSSDDFEIIGEDQGTIVVPRTGKSRKNATFTISPKKNGAGTIQAFFLANNRVFQQMKLTIQVGAIAPKTSVLGAATTGKTFGSAFVAPARGQEVDLVILKRDAGYEFLLTSGGFKRAVVNLSEQQIADLTTTAREELKKIVYAKDGARFVYQLSDTTIPATVHAQTLKTLMGIGFDLFEALFFAPGSGADANEIGRVLREKSRQSKLNIAIIAERFSFPWSLLYDRDFDPDRADPDGFWGFKHVIEYTPEFRNATTVSFSPEITAGETLELAFVVNTTIDDELRRKGSLVDVIKPQQEFLRQLKGVNVTEYPNGSDLVRLLRDANGKTQLIYFYCHAESALPGATGGVDASRVLLSDGPVTLKDLKRAAPLSKVEENLQSCPLVFLNACESAELSPYLYDGLVPYLIAKGARGVIGTEVNTPALFAAEFAQTFLERFTAGDQPIGELLLQMRREYLHTKNNIMGLVYALHSGAEVVVKRAG